MTAPAAPSVAVVIHCACSCPDCPPVEGRSERDAERHAEHRMWTYCPDGRWFCSRCADAGHITPVRPLTDLLCDCSHAHPWPCTCSDCTACTAPAAALASGDAA